MGRVGVENFSDSLNILKLESIDCSCVGGVSVSHLSVSFCSSSTNLMAIDNKIEQAMVSLICTVPSAG